MERRRTVGYVVILEGESASNVAEGILESLEFLRREADAMGMNDVCELLEQAHWKASQHRHVH